MSCAQYTMPNDKVLKGNAVGVITVINNNGEKVFYELFDVVVPEDEATYSKGSNDEKVVDKLHEVSILDVVPSYRNVKKAETIKLYQDYPELTDVVYKSLEETNMAKLNNQHSLISTMVRSALRTTAQARVEKLRRELKDIEQARETGFEY